MADIIKFPHTHIHVAVSLAAKARVLKDSHPVLAAGLFQEAVRLLLDSRSSRRHIESLWRANEVLFSQLRNQEGIACWTEVKFNEDSEKVKTESKLHNMCESFKNWCIKAVRNSERPSNTNKTTIRKKPCRILPIIK